MIAKRGNCIIATDYSYAHSFNSDKKLTISLICFFVRMFFISGMLDAALVRFTTWAFSITSFCFSPFITNVVLVSFANIPEMVWPFLSCNVIKPKPGASRAPGLIKDSSICWRLSLEATPFKRGPALPPRSSYEWHLIHWAFWLLKKILFPRSISPPCKLPPYADSSVSGDKVLLMSLYLVASVVEWLLSIA